ncbi:MAG: hypothetical protein HGA27_07285, partial [Peptococcaceae bacterium]|nr:hypothetical protein [Peptococcaceae bacterium]
PHRYVPTTDYREHKGLFWILNYQKIANKQTDSGFNYNADYFGYHPDEKTYKIKALKDSGQIPNLIYLADTYGVYTDDLKSKPTEERSEKIYGGLSQDELSIIKKNLYNNTLITEFNSMGSPTSPNSRRELESISGVKWSGWIGRYFPDLSNREEIPKWMTELYESQNKKSWKFMQEGYILISDENRIEVLEKGKDFDKASLKISFLENYQQEFTSGSAEYDYWFEWLTPGVGTETLANYTLSLNSAGRDKLTKLGLKTEFPAIMRNVSYFTSYYFAGDFADYGNTASIYKYQGINLLKKYAQFHIPGTNNTFYWKIYVPMMQKILADIADKNNLQPASISVYKNGPISYTSKIEKNRFQIYNNGKWENMVIKGVDLGMAKPGSWPGEAAITLPEYYRWFKYIGDMGANAIRIYTIHPPDFYKALWMYNNTHKTPLYVFHGIWVEEEKMTETLNAFHPDNILPFQQEMRNVVDIIHGKGNLAAKAGHASGEYKYDISPWVIGWITGTEWDPIVVENTNRLNRNVKDYQGRFFSSQKASPFEIWLAESMDYLLSYETDKYSWQRPVSFTNWPTADLLKHPAEPFEEEDMVVINPNNIYETKALYCGYFASYHIYPYYPDFINYEEKYQSFKDHRGNKNSYAAYLNELIDAHRIPVLIAEFGVPSSRGKAHENKYGWNQGGLTDTQQGQINSSLFQDIIAQGYLGGFVFTWQDEWFKRTWNTMELDNESRRPYWSNQQTNEQHFGLLGFESNKMPLDGKGEKYLGTAPIYFDNKNNNPLIKRVYQDQDECYLYFRVEYDSVNTPMVSEMPVTTIALDSIADQGNFTLPGKTGLTGDLGFDFAITVSPRETESRVLVDSYYDPFYYQYGYLNKFLPQKTPAQKNSGLYNPIRFALAKPMLIPSTGEKVEFKYYEAGKLRLGNGNPEAADYNSLADYIYNPLENALEIRIPWLLLNIKDPSQKEILADLWHDGLNGSRNISGIKAAVIAEKNSQIYSLPAAENKLIPGNKMAVITWENWEIPTSREYLKKSYYIMKETFSKEYK